MSNPARSVLSLRAPFAHVFAHVFTQAARMLACVCWFGAVAANPHLSDDLVPDPALEPGEVVRIQLEALRHNPDDDKGIEVVFRFASPGNRAQTGPLERFKRMIRNGPYALMLNFDEVIYDTVDIQGDTARQRVVLVSRTRTLGYEFVLSRQSQAPYENCWMTDSVGVVRISGHMARRATPHGAAVFASVRR